jgi:molybdopterin converting factor small subunit
MTETSQRDFFDAGKKNGFAEFRLVGSFGQFKKTDARSAGDRNLKSQSLEAPLKLEQAIEKIGERLQLKLPLHSMLILINGIEASVLGGMDAVINENDNVVIVPMFHGG